MDKKDKRRAAYMAKQAELKSNRERAQSRKSELKEIREQRSIRSAEKKKADLALKEKMKQDRLEEMNNDAFKIMTDLIIDDFGFTDSIKERVYLLFKQLREHDELIVACRLIFCICNWLKDEAESEAFMASIEKAANELLDETAERFTLWISDHYGKSHMIEDHEVLNLYFDGVYKYDGLSKHQIISIKSWIDMLTAFDGTASFRNHSLSITDAAAAVSYGQFQKNVPYPMSETDIKSSVEAVEGFLESYGVEYNELTALREVWSVNRYTFIYIEQHIINGRALIDPKEIGQLIKKYGTDEFSEVTYKARYSKDSLINKYDSLITAIPELAG